MPALRRKTPQIPKTEDLSAHTLLQYPIRQQCGIWHSCAGAAEAIRKSKSSDKNQKLIWHLFGFFRNSCSFSASAAALASNCICRDFLFHLSRTYLRLPLRCFLLFSRFFRFAAGKSSHFRVPGIFRNFHTRYKAAAMPKTPTTVTPMPIPHSMLRHIPHSNSLAHFRRSFPHKISTIERSRSIHSRMRFSVSVNFFNFVSNSPHHL